MIDLFSSKDRNTTHNDQFQQYITRLIYLHTPPIYSKQLNSDTDKEQIN